MTAQTLSQTAVMVGDMLERMLTGAATPGGTVWDADLWHEIRRNGFADALASTLTEQPGDEDALGVPGALNLLFTAGRHAAPVPLAEHLVAGWIAALAGLEPAYDLLVPAGFDAGDTLSLEAEDRVSGALHKVPFARHANAVVAISGDRLLLIPTEGASMDHAENAAGEPRDTVHVRSASCRSAPFPRHPRTARAALAAARVMQIAGAIDAAVGLTADYVQQRQQFGRPISKFQAVQQAIAELGGQAAATRAAATIAAMAFGADDGVPAIAAAKIRAGEAVGPASRMAHQLHGAIGYTQEYPLQRFTRRLWGWRDDYGSETQWARWLGLSLSGDADRNAETLWPAIAGGLSFVAPETVG